MHYHISAGVLPEKQNLKKIITGAITAAVTVAFVAIPARAAPSQ